MIEFLCIGAQKAATSWLYHNLKSHPRIWMPPFIKEVHYYDIRFLDPPNRQRRTKDFKKRARRFEWDKEKHNPAVSIADYVCQITDNDRMYTDAWYDDVFSVAPAGLLRGEVTPNYCAIGDDGIDHLKRCYPQVKLIYIIREPYGRMISSLTMSIARRSRRHRKQFPTGAALSVVCRDVIANPIFWMLGDYQSNVPRWDKYFSGSQLLYLPFGNVRIEPAKMLRTIEDFIGVDTQLVYDRAQDQVHKGSSISIPREFTERLASAAEIQRAFLKDRFGSQFLEQIS
jgi:hypothetical protein